MTQLLVGWQPETQHVGATWHVRLQGQQLTACGRTPEYWYGVPYPEEGGLLCALCLGTWQKRAVETKLIQRLELQLAAAKRLMASP